MSHLDAVKKNAGFTEDTEDLVERVIFDLKNSNLPTLVVEGDHDKAIYRWIEKIFNTPKISILLAHGKDNLIEIYKRRSEYDEHIAVAFMADLDKEVFGTRGKGARDECPDVIWTKGYSLENDLYSDGNPENIIDQNKKEEHKKKLENAIHNFAKEVAYWANRGRKPNNKDINRYFCQIQKEYKLMLRGKNLFEVLLNFCAARNHLELCKDVFDTIDLEKKDPPLISRLILGIKKEIRNKQKAIENEQPTRKFTAQSLFANSQKTNRMRN